MNAVIPHWIIVISNFRHVKDLVPCLSQVTPVQIGSCDYSYVLDVLNMPDVSNTLSQWFINFSMHQSHMEVGPENLYF